MKSKMLNAALVELVRDETLCQRTLRAVQDVLDAHAGTRVVLTPWAGRASRYRQAVRIARKHRQDGQLDRASAIKAIVQGVGVSESTARRYIQMMGRTE